MNHAESIEIPDGIARRLTSASRWLVLTGAGISAESGVPTFRGAGGLWEGSRPEELASPEGFRRDPARVWRWYRWRRSVVANVAPNEGHSALARVESSVPSFVLVTQNVDGLHRRAGSRRVLELHGNIMRSRCHDDCGRDLHEDPNDETPRCACGAPLRPDVVWFGEPLDPHVLESSFDAARKAEVCLVVGTSGVVQPAATLPIVAARQGALLVEVNPEETPLSSACTLTLRGPAAVVLPRLAGRLFPAGNPGAPNGV